MLSRLGVGGSTSIRPLVVSPGVLVDACELVVVLSPLDSGGLEVSFDLQSGGDTGLESVDKNADR